MFARTAANCVTSSRPLDQGGWLCAVMRPWSGRRRGRRQTRRRGCSQTPASGPPGGCHKKTRGRPTLHPGPSPPGAPLQQAGRGERDVRRRQGRKPLSDHMQLPPPPYGPRTVQRAQRGGQACDVGGRQVRETAAAHRDAIKHHHDWGREQEQQFGDEAFGLLCRPLGGRWQACMAAAAGRGCVARHIWAAPEQTEMQSMPTGASCATAACTAASAVNSQLPRVNTAHTAPARASPNAAPLLQHGEGAMARVSAALRWAAAWLRRSAGLPTAHRSRRCAHWAARAGCARSRASRVWAARLRGSGK